MEITFDKDYLSINTKGIAYLKLKSDIYNIIGNALIVSKENLKIPLSCVDMLYSLLSKVFNNGEYKPSVFDLHSKARKIALDSLEKKQTDSITSYWNEILDIPQKYAVDAMVTKNLLGMCLFDEQGSGKTVMTIASFDILKEIDIIDSMIIICPKSMIQGWEEDIKKFLGNKYKTLIPTQNLGNKRDSLSNEYDILILNYESLESILVPLLAICSTNNTLLVIDESYYAKNKASIRSGNAVKLRDHCVRCFVLCGTPAPNSPYDLINQFNLADKGYTFSTFKSVGDEKKDKVIISDLINNRGTYIRRLKKDVFTSIPKKAFQIINIELKGYQKYLYEKAKKELELQLRTFDNRTFKKNLSTYFQKRSALLQICSIPKNIDPNYSETPSKYPYLDNLLGNLLLQGRKVIIWTYYKESVKELLSRYAKYKPLHIDGGSTMSERQDSIKYFQESDEYLLLIANPGAAGAGITLHASYDAIYFSYTNQAAHYLQSLDRIHRRGQKSKTVNYYLFVCNNTIEENEVIRLRARELQQHELLGDTIVWPSSLDEALSELSGVQ
jgi:SNF2 family DNA or RNA helicase